jgi:monoterpene epsilon-lactone hydrolase
MTIAQLTPICSMLREKPVIVAGATPEDMRKGLDTLGDLAPRLAAVTTLAVSAGGIDAEWLVPRVMNGDRAVLYLHGGGYVCGSVQSHRILLERLAISAGCRILALNYRLAPENPFPAPIEDACAAYRWLVGQNISPRRIAIVGDSAGGGLTFATLIVLREAGDVLPACAVAISPWVDMECLGESMHTRATADPMVQKSAVDYLAQLYLQGADPKSPLASPLYGNLAALPPTLIQVGDAEVLLDDTTRIASRLEADGVDVSVETWPDMIHVWHLFASMLDEGQAAIERIGEFVRRHTE